MNEIELLKKLAETAASRPPTVDVARRVEASIAATPTQPVALWIVCAGVSSIAAGIMLAFVMTELTAWPVSEFFEEIASVIT